jgi:preprotein translocase subunit YajC
VLHPVWILSNVALAQVESGAPPADAPSPSPFGGNMMFIFIAFFAIMYFFMIRPQQKREKERRQMLASITKGAKVITNGGLHGTVVGLTEKDIILRVSDDPTVKLRFVRGSVARVLSNEEAKETDEEES